MKKYIMIFFSSTLILIISLRYYQLKFDGVLGEVLGLILKTDTEYSNNYSDKKFANIKIGMSENEVKKILGALFVEWKYGDKIINEYSRSPADTNYRIRQIHFLATSRNVCEIKTEFYGD